MTIEKYIEILEKTGECKCKYENGKINVTGDVTLLFQNDLPYKFGIVTGNFSLFAAEGMEFKGIDNLPDKAQGISLQKITVLPKNFGTDFLNLESCEGDLVLGNIKSVIVSDSKLNITARSIGKFYIDNSTVKLNVKEVQSLYLSNLTDYMLKLNELPKINKNLSIVNVNIQEDFPEDKITTKTKVKIEESNLKSYLGLLSALAISGPSNIRSLYSDYKAMKEKAPNMTPSKFQVLLDLMKLNE